MGKFNFLKDEFCDWYMNLYAETWTEWHTNDIPEELLDELKMSEDEYRELFIRPYIKLARNLSKEQLKLAIHSLGNNLTDYCTPQPSPFCLDLIMSINPKLNALDWLLVHVADLAFFDFSEEIQKRYKKPLRQCIVCGLPDEYPVINPADKVLYKKFDNRTNHCHKFDCTTGDSNTGSGHSEGCHYKEWARTKKTLGQKIERAVEKAHNIDENYSFADKERDQKIMETPFQIFMDFCEQQLEKNMQIQYTIQHQDLKAINLNDF